MAKDKMNIPQIRFKGFEGEWNNELLKNLLSFSNGVNAPKENYGKGRKMISVLDILNKGRLHYSNILNSVFVDNITEQKNKVVKGDLVFIRSSEIVEEVGLAKAYLDDDYALHSGFTICGTKISDFDSFFLELSLNSVNRKEVERKAGGSTRYNVSQTVLNNIYLFMPSQSEQIQIGDFFQKIDQVIELQQKALDTARAYKQSMLQKMFPQKGEKVPRVRFAGFSGDWEQRRLSNIVKINPSAQLPMTFKYVDLESVKGHILMNVRKESRETAPSRAQRVAIKNDIFYQTVRPYQRNNYLFDLEDTDYVFSTGYAQLRPKKVIISLFLFSVIQTVEFLKRVLIRCTGTSYPAINSTDLGEITISFPSLEEQTAIGNFFQKLDQQIEQQRQKLATYQQLKKAMLQRMFV